MPTIPLCRSPRIMLIGDFLTGEEIDHLIALATPMLKRSYVEAGDDPRSRKAVSDHRTSHSAQLPRVDDDEIMRRIEERAAGIAGIPASHIENLQVVRYRQEEQYKDHFDWYEPSDARNKILLERDGQRMATLIVYLNKPEEGGATSFPQLKIKVKPQRGWGLYWDNCKPNSIEGDRRTKHRGEPVTKGEKWIANIWFRSKPFRQFTAKQVQAAAAAAPQAAASASANPAQGDPAPVQA